MRPLRYALAGGALAFAAYRSAGLAAQAHVLEIDHIVVHGNAHMATGEVLAVLSGLHGQSLLRADLGEWRHRLLSSSWIRDADLRRSLPSTIDVVVTERQPSGIARIDGRLYLVDDRGVVIDEYSPQYAEFDLPMIDGLPRPGDEGATDPARMELAARVMASLEARPEIAKRVSQIDVRDLHNAAVILNGDPAVIQLGDQQFLHRLQSYLELAPTVRDRIADIDYVDVRFDNRVYVRPAGKPPKTVRKDAAPAAAPRPPRRAARKGRWGR